jgi:hypothetical protein
MVAEVDCLTTSQCCLDLLGENGSGSKATNELLAAFAALILATLIYGYRLRDVPVSPSNEVATIDAGQHVAVIGNPRASVGFRIGGTLARRICFELSINRSHDVTFSRCRRPGASPDYTNSIRRPRAARALGGGDLILFQVHAGTATQNI